MPWDDLEPIDLEPVDLGPVDREAGAGTATSEPGRGPGRTWLWIAVAGAGLAAWAGVAASAGTGHGRAAPTAPTTPTTLATGDAPVELFQPASAVESRLLQRLAHYWCCHFAAVIDDRLYVVARARPPWSLVGLSPGQPVIVDQNGRSLLTSTDQETLVSTDPIRSVTVSDRDTPIRGVAPGTWWLFRNDGTIRLHESDPPVLVPGGLRVVAEVKGGFIALDAQHSRWVLWSGSKMTRIADGSSQFLAAGPQMVVFKDRCGYSGCFVDIHDLAHNSTVVMRWSRIPAFAAFSPDGLHLALASTLGDVLMVDTADARILAQTRGRRSPSPSLPFTWTPDSQALLVVQDHSLAVRNASNGATESVIRGTDGLEQLVALP